MKKAMTISYEIGDHLYLNLTNRCPCACTFCIRKFDDGAYGSDPLWLEHEPSWEEVKADLEQRDLSRYAQVIFCGFGEPTERMELLQQVAQYLKQQGVGCVRLNTNGLTDLIYGKPMAHLLKGCVDIVSISLNAGTAEEYLSVTRPKFGEAAFPAMQAFALSCRQYVPQVLLTVVDVLPEPELAAAKALAEKLGLPLRIRAFDS